MAQKTRIRLTRGERNKISESNDTLLRGELLLDTTDGYLISGRNDGDAVNNSSNIITTNRIVGYASDGNTLSSNAQNEYSVKYNQTDTALEIKSPAEVKVKSDFGTTIDAGTDVSINAEDDISIKSTDGTNTFASIEVTHSDDENDDTADVSISASGDIIETASGDITETATGNIELNATGDASITSSGGISLDATGSVGIESDDDITISAIQSGKKVIINNNTSVSNDGNVLRTGFISINGSSGDGINISNTENSSNNIKIGNNASVLNYSALGQDGITKHSIAIGDNSCVEGVGLFNPMILWGSNGIAIGYNARESGSQNGIAIGNNSSTITNNNSIAIGNNSTGYSHDSIAIGNSARAEGTSSGAIGNGARAIGLGSFQIGKGINSTNHTLRFENNTIANASHLIGDIATNNIISLSSNSNVSINGGTNISSNGKTITTTTVNASTFNGNVSGQSIDVNTMRAGNVGASLPIIQLQNRNCAEPTVEGLYACNVKETSSGINYTLILSITDTKAAHSVFFESRMTVTVSNSNDTTNISVSYLSGGNITCFDMGFSLDSCYLITSYQ